MQRTKFEFKARASDLLSLENKLLTLSPKFIGEDQQVDTYFNVERRRLKLHEAIDTHNFGIEKLKEQSTYYADFFGIKDSDYESKILQSFGLKSHH